MPVQEDLALRVVLAAQHDGGAKRVREPRRRDKDEAVRHAARKAYDSSEL